MGRFLMYFTIGALAVFVLVASLLLQHGGGSTAAISQVSVHDLGLTPPLYRGKVVTTEGLLNFNPDRSRYEITDGTSLAIMIRTSPPAADLESLSGKRVRVTGRFDFDETSGIYMDADVIRLAAAGTR